MVKEHPIPFGTPMVRALLNDRKTQTRRTVKKLLKHGPITEFEKSDTKGYDWHFRDKKMRWHDMDNARVLQLCPYGTPGDRLWVRETWQGYKRTSYEYNEWEAAETIKDVTKNGYTSFEYATDGKSYPERWFPSIYMPRIASRILLEIINVKVERLTDISEEDAIAEGCISTAVVNEAGDDYTGEYPSEVFRRLWQSINGPGSWGLNPWVWVIKFKRIG